MPSRRAQSCAGWRTTIRCKADAAASGVARVVARRRAEGYALRTAYDQANDRIIEQDRAVEKARITLAAWIGA